MSPRYPLLVEDSRDVFMAIKPLCEQVGLNKHSTGAIPLSCQ